jgi:serine/threonine protein kinase
VESEERVHFHKPGRYSPIIRRTFMPLGTGVRFGPYEILSALGAGGMGEVYKARDSRLNRTVALKVLPAELAADPERRARFEREAHAIAALSHPHICTIHDVGRDNGTDYLVMELLEGETLAERLASGSRLQASVGRSPKSGARSLPLNEVLRYAAEIADALDKAHRAGIVHRDLKPANIMLTKSGAKLLDFGLAKLKGPAVPISMTAIEHATTTSGPKTATGTILGTVHYMSPEQVEGREADARSDIWALGVVLYEMATGTRPFDGESAASIIGAILKDTPATISARQPLSPPALDHVVERCLDKDSDERWQHAGDIKRELTWIARALTAATPNAAGSTARRRSIAPILAWTLVVVLAALLGLSQFSARSAASPIRDVVRLDLDMPAGVETAPSNSPNVALSSDGRRIAFTGGEGGVRRLYVRRLDGADVTQLRGTEAVNICFFSPDGSALGFVTADRILKKVSLADGLVTTVVSNADYGPGGAAWTPDGQIVFVRGGALWEVPGTGLGQPRQLTFLDASKGEKAHAWPTVTGDGKSILFTAVTGGARTAMRIEALSRATGERHAVVEGRYPMYASSGHLVFFRDNALLAAQFDSDRNVVMGQAAAVIPNVAVDQLGAPMAALSRSGMLAYVPASATRRLVWVSRQGVEEPIVETPRPYQGPRLGPDGHRIVVEVAGGDLWIEDIARATFTKLTTSETVGNTFAVWTPDSHRVIFRTVTGMWWIDPDGGGRPQPIPDTSGNDVPSAVSPDGETLVYIRQTTETAGDLYRLSLKGDPSPQPLVVTNGYDGGGQFSPDGHWLAYVTNESGSFEVCVRPYPGPDRKLQISTAGGTHPKWARNGKELFYRNGNKMMVVDVAMRGGDIVLSQPRVLFEHRYYFGTSQTLANYDISADGQRFVMIRDDSSSGRLSIVLNWFEELKERVRAQ